MVPLKLNLPVLQTSFSRLNSASLKSLVNPAGQVAINDYIAQCKSTNEISGLERALLKNEKWILIPSFVRDANKHELLRAIANNHADKLDMVEETKPYMSFHFRDNWRMGDFQVIDHLMTLDDHEKIIQRALNVAYAVLKRSPEKLDFVCGPISHPDKEVVEKNLDVFNCTVFKKGQEKSIFNQLPFEPLFEKVHGLLVEHHPELLGENQSSSNFFVDRFYSPLFIESRKTWNASFIDGWKSSVGAKREHEIFKSLGSSIEYLEKDYYRTN